jgi:hypothetical protein
MNGMAGRCFSCAMILHASTADGPADGLIRISATLPLEISGAWPHN